MSSVVPFHVPSIGEEEIQAVTNTLRSGWLTSGPNAKQFESEFAAYVGAAHALAVNSCTAGLHLALAALGIGPGDEVITTPLTFCATVNTILHVGATPVLADIKPDGNIDPDSIEQRITARTRAILPVHIAGLPCDMDRIWALARRHNLFVVEDAAHAVGTQYKGIAMGGHDPASGGGSDAVAFSFYATKNLTTGEGGMVTTHNAQLAKRMKILCLHGISADAWNRYGAQGKWFYEVIASGFKYNMADIQAAMGIPQLRKQEQFIAIRRHYASLYTEAFRDIPALEPPPDDAATRHCWHLYTLRLNLDHLTIDRAQFCQELQARGIAHSVHFIPIPLHPFYKDQDSIVNSPCPAALELYPRLVSLPLYPAMSVDDVNRVIEAVRDIATQFSVTKRAQLATA
jgi:dTDP-4-amino-4,6-dideoxygalactose transaminase